MHSTCIFHFEQTSFLIIQNYIENMVLTVQMVNKIRNNLEKNAMIFSETSRKKTDDI